MVSRKRKVVDVKKPVFRDPRFDNMGGAAPDENTLGHRYAFLNDYRASEIAELRSTIKKTKNEAEKEKLKKKLLSMESQQKAREAKEQQQQVVRDHKKKEKELVTQGKQPFFLKKCMSFCHVLANITGHWMLTISSRAKETCPDRPLPEHEIEAARPCHRTPSQEGHRQGAQEHAREANGVSILPAIGLRFRRAGIALVCSHTHSSTVPCTSINSLSTGVHSSRTDATRCGPYKLCGSPLGSMHAKCSFHGPFQNFQHHLVKFSPIAMTA
jgi:hypothetical protein